VDVHAERVETTPISEGQCVHRCARRARVLAHEPRNRTRVVLMIKPDKLLGPTCETHAAQQCHARAPLEG
jgi:hypothetical protein